jgi:Arc/MetJ-type ribon-helix-helix transcriptional regulator
MQDRKDISVCMPGELDAAIKDHLSYGDSKSEWIREAIRQRLNQDDADAGPDTALEAHSSEPESPDDQSTRGGA